MKKLSIITAIILTAIIGCPSYATTALQTPQGNKVISTLPQPTEQKSGREPADDEIIYNYYSEITGFKKDSKWGFYTTERGIIIPPTYTDIEAFNNKYIEVDINGKKGLIDLKGIAVTAPEYDEIKNTGSFILVEKSDLWGILDSDCRVLIKPKYEDISYLSGNYFKVELNDLKGIIDKNDKIIIKIKYEDVGLLKGGYFKIKQNELWGAVDSNEKVCVSPAYEKIEKTYGIYFKVKRNGKWGAVNNAGKVVIPLEYGPFKINKKIKELIK